MEHKKPKKRIVLIISLVIVLGVTLFRVDMNRLRKGNPPIFSVKVSEYNYIGLGYKTKYVKGGYATQLFLWGDFSTAGEPSNHATLLYVGYK